MEVSIERLCIIAVFVLNAFLIFKMRRYGGRQSEIVSITSSPCRRFHESWCCFVECGVNFFERLKCIQNHSLIPR